ncbi:MAG: hypothetical protein WC460_04090 [Patescibacteria group bacterium]
MKSLNEMTGVEAIEAFIEGARKFTLQDIVSIFGANDFQILSRKARISIMEFFSEQSFLFKPMDRANYEEEYLQKFFSFIGVDSTLPINEVEIIEKSMKNGNGNAVRNIFSIVIRANPLVLGDLSKKAKEQMLYHLHDGRINAEEEVLNKDNFRSPEYIAGLKALLS